MTDDGAVSRETRAREIALDIFGSRAGTAEEYASLLLGDATLRGLLGPREGSRLWERHLLNSAVVGEFLVPDQTVVDIGSGAGLPGIPLALTAAAPRVTLVEPLLRRTRFLDEAVATLGLRESVEVLRHRAEALPGERRWDVATARAVAPLEVLARLARPLLASAGRLLAIKGASASQELEALEPDLRKIGFRHGRVVRCGPEGFATTVVELW